MSLNEMDCNELVELVTAYLDNALDEETRARFEAHLTECDGCENYLEQFRATVRTRPRLPQPAARRIQGLPRVERPTGPTPFTGDNWSSTCEGSTLSEDATLGTVRLTARTTDLVVA